MGYATAAEVQSEFKSIIFSTTTLVTIADVDSFITQTDALINSYIGMRYLVPVTADVSSLSLLKLFCLTLVADRIKKILEVKQTSPNQTANQDVRGAYGTKDVMKALDDIKKNILALSGATPLVSNGGFFSNNVANHIEPVFHKEDRQW